MEAYSSPDKASSASSERIQLCAACDAAKFFDAEYPSHFRSMNRAPLARQMSAVRSVEKESTTSTSSASPFTDCRQRPMLRSSLRVMMTTDNAGISLQVIYFSRNTSTGFFLFLCVAMNIQQLLSGIATGDFKTLARAVTWVENERPGYETLLKSLPASTVPIVGFTGPPGA